MFLLFAGGCLLSGGLTGCCCLLSGDLGVFRWLQLVGFWCFFLFGLMVVCF